MCSFNWCEFLLNKMKITSSLIREKKRKREGPTNRWSREQTTLLLEALVDKVKDNPECFEKPTAQKFYAVLFEKYGLAGIAELGVNVTKNKVRNLKKTYINAEEWRNKTGAGLLEEGKEQSVKEYIEKICPYFEYLQQIFGQRKNVNIPVILDSEDPDILFEEAVEYVYEDEEYLEEGQEVQEEEPTDCAYTDNAYNNTTNPKDPTTSAAAEQPSKVDHSLNNKKRTRRSTNSSLEYLSIISERRMELEKLKFKEKIKIEEERLNLEKERLQLEKDKLKAEIDLKKLEVEKQFQLKKLELELKYKYKED